MARVVEGAKERIVLEQIFWRVEDIKKELEQNIINGNRKVKYSNLPLLAMLDNFDDNQLFGLIRSKSNDIPFDRGSVAECALKALLNGRAKVRRAAKKGNDLPRPRKEELRQIFKSVGLNPARNYEIKFSTSYAYGSPLDEKAKDVIVITPTAVFVLDRETVNTNASGHVITKQPYAAVNRQLTEWLLGI